ncbi:unnamed protein product [Ectocarpus sp. 12 AP-2014]
MVCSLLLAVYIPDHNWLWLVDDEVHATGRAPHPWPWAGTRSAREIHFSGVQVPPLQWYRSDVGGSPATPSEIRHITHLTWRNTACNTYI